LKNIIRDILQQIGATKIGSLSEMFSDIFEDTDPPFLDKIQIICPRRVGNFGSSAINNRVIRDNNFDFTPRTKLICEKNIYTYASDKDGNRRRILGLANGSIGYVQSDGKICFEDLEDIRAEYDG